MRDEGAAEKRGKAHVRGEVFLAVRISVGSLVDQGDDVRRRSPPQLRGALKHQVQGLARPEAVCSRESVTESARRQRTEAAATAAAAATVAAAAVTATAAEERKRDRIKMRA